MASTWVGIDLGTSACKVLALSEEGAVLRTAVRHYAVHTPRAGWAEQDPADWWQAADEGVREVLGALAGEYDIQALGLCGQMHGLTALDADGEVIRPAFLWNDQRAAPQCHEITERAGGLDGLLKLIQNAMLPGYTAGKLLWLREHEPDHYAEMRWLLNPKDYLRLRMTGDIATEVSDASGTGLFDVRQRRWSEQLLRLLDIPVHVLPRVVESSEVTGGLTAEVAGHWGLPAGTPVVGGGGDSVLQTTSTGVVREGTIGITLGTAGIVGGAATACPQHPDGRLQISCGNAPDRWHVMGVALNTGGAFQWLRDALRSFLPGEHLDFSRLVELARSAPPGSEGLLFLPYLLGERCPQLAPDARGAWVGLTPRHTAAHLARSVMEGVLLNLREILTIFADSGLIAAEVRVSGGATGEPLWLQMLADVLQTEVVTLTGGEQGGAFGAALLAAVGTGHWESLDAASRLIVETGRIVPDPTVAPIYGRLSALYRQLLPALETTFAGLVDLEP